MSASSNPNSGSYVSSHSSPSLTALSSLSRHASITRSQNSSRFSSSRKDTESSKSLNASAALPSDMSAQPMKNQANHEDTPAFPASLASSTTVLGSFSSYAFCILSTYFSDSLSRSVSASPISSLVNLLFLPQR